MRKEIMVEFHRRLHSIVNKHKTLDRINRDFEAGEFLNGSEIHTISSVGDLGMPTITQIANHLGVSKAAASQSIGNLCNSGYIRKMKDEKKKREVFLVLTEKGQRAYAAHKDLWKDQCMTYIADLPEELIEHFNIVAERIEQMADSQIDVYR
jgi:DNA-binding MarR family transcriptional regulator